jgi:hypothetical protein
MDKVPFTRDMKVTSSSGVNVQDTKQLKGEASKDSLSGTNQTVEYSPSQKVSSMGPFSGQNTGS